MRLTKLRERFEDLGVDALLVTHAQNRRYLCGFTGSAGSLLITQDKALLATDSRYWEQAEKQAPGFDVVRLTKLLHTHLGELLEQAGSPHRVGIESAAVTLAEFDKWKELEIDVEWIITKDVVEPIRAVKDEAEVAAIRKAVALGDAGFDYLCSFIKPGMTEREIAWDLEVYLRTHGAESLSFETIVATGPNAAMAHHRPSERVVQKSEPILVDFGVVVDGYCSDLTRTISLGNGDPKFTEIYDVVQRAQQAALDGIHAGMIGKDADALARDVIEAAGYGDNFGHGLGHGVGLAIHEAPGASRMTEEPLPAGATLTVEPGVYLPGWGGVRIEDLVIVGEQKTDVLSRAHKRSII